MLMGEVERLCIAAGSAALVFILGFPVRYFLFHMLKTQPGPGPHRMLAQRTTELVVHSFIRPTFLILASCAFIDETFRRYPFTGWDPYVNIVLGAFLGHLTCQLVVTSSQYPVLVRHCSGQPIHLIIMSICYATIVLSGRDAALGIIGLIVYFPGLHGNIHSVLKRLQNKHGCRVNLKLRVVSMLVFGFGIPAVVMVLLNIFCEPVIILGGLFFSLFCITIAYWSVVNFFELRLIFSAIQEHGQGDLGTIHTQGSMDESRNEV